MCPAHHNPEPPGHEPTNNTNNSCMHMKKPPFQPTLWQFIHPWLQAMINLSLAPSSPSQNTNPPLTPTTNLPPLTPNTQTGVLHTPPTPTQEHPSLHMPKENRGWGNISQYEKPLIISRSFSKVWAPTHIYLTWQPLQPNWKRWKQACFSTVNQYTAECNHHSDYPNTSLQSVYPFGYVNIG